MSTEHVAPIGRGVWDAEKGKFVWVEPTPVFPADGAEPIGLTVGTITFSPDCSAPCHCANCVVLEQEVERLRRGIAEIQTMNSQLQRELDTKNARMARIVELESANKHLQDRIYDLEGKA